MARIFISHSCKVASPGEDPRLTFARGVRDRIRAKLCDAGHEPLLDVRSLEPGVAWRASLDRWLGDCDGAIVLLDGLSVRSDWLKREATVLAWRRSLGPRPLLVSVFLGDVRPRDLPRAGFGAIDLGAWQGVGPEPDAETLVEQAVQAFHGLTTHADDSPMGRWLEDVAALVKPVGPVHQNRARLALDIDQDDWDAFSDGHMTIASRLLHGGLGEACRAVTELKPDMGLEAVGRLVDQVLPTWVDAAAAAHVSALLAADERPVLLINADEQEVGMDYVSRAQCRVVDATSFVTATDVAGEGGADELLPRYANAFRARASLREGRPNPLLKKPELLAAFLTNPPKFVLLGPGAARTDLLGMLQRDYGGARFVVLSADHYGAHANAPAAVLVEPVLTAERLDEIDLVRLAANNLAA